jgi:hypothetical protein
LGCIQAPRTSTQAETATNNGNGSMTTVKCGATYRPTDAKYFEELDKRLAETVRLPTRAKPKSPVAPVTEGATHSKTKVVLTKQDLAFMEKMGLDPKNPRDLKAFAAERRNSLRNS